MQMLSQKLPFFNLNTPVNDLLIGKLVDDCFNNHFSPCYKQPLLCSPWQIQSSCCTCRSSDQSFADLWASPSPCLGMISSAGWRGSEGFTVKEQEYKIISANFYLHVYMWVFRNLGCFGLQGDQTRRSVRQDVEVRGRRRSHGSGPTLWVHLIVDQSPLL